MPTFEIMALLSVRFANIGGQHCEVLISFGFSMHRLSFLIIGLLIFLGLFTKGEIVTVFNNLCEYY